MASFHQRRVCLTLLLCVITAMNINRSMAASLTPHRHSKLAFEVFTGCSGKYDMAIYTVLSGMCEDCAKLYKLSNEFYRDCRKDCFTTPHFDSCLDLLFVEAEKRNKIMDDLSVIHFHPDMRMVYTLKEDSNHPDTRMLYKSNEDPDESPEKMSSTSYTHGVNLL